MSEPTTSDMTVEQILVNLVVNTCDERHKQLSGKQSLGVTLGRIRFYEEQALAAINAIRKVDMEYIAQNHGVKLGILIEQRLNNTPSEGLTLDEQMRRLRLNNTEDGDAHIS